MTHRFKLIDFSKCMLGGGTITLDKFNCLHSFVIKNTSSDIPENYGYRDGSRDGDDDIWVGTFYDDERKIDYIPPVSSQVLSHMCKILHYCNNIEDEETLECSILKAFFIHAQIAILQPFRDGNTRTARVFQHVYLWEKTCQKLNVTFSSPVLYLSDNYKLYRAQYRNMLTNIAIMPNSASWSKWLQFNLNMMDEQLFKLNNDLHSLVKVR